MQEHVRVADLMEGSELDAASGPLLRQRLEGRLSRCRRAAVDLAGISFIDSSGLKSLLSACEEAWDRGAELRIVNPGRQVRSVFECLGIGQLLRAG